MGSRGLRVLTEGGHRHQAGDAHWAALDEGSELRGGDAALALLSGYVDLDQDLGVGGGVLAELLQDRVGGARVDQAAKWQELLHLAALQVADEVPLEGVAPALALGDQLLLAVLADQRH